MPALDFRPLYRLRKTDEYSSVFAFRRAIKGRYFMLHYRPADSGPRLGLVMAKKLAKRAVLRNLLKRLAREHFRHVRANLPAYDVVLRLSAPPLRASRAELHEDIVNLLQRLPR